MILNLAVWFALHRRCSARSARCTPIGVKLQVPVLASVNVASIVLAVAALVAMLRFKVGMIPVLAASAALGALYI